LRIAGLDLLEARRVGGGDICRAWSARTEAGARVFAKSLAQPPSGFFEAEAAGLDRLRGTDGPPVPEIVAVGPDGLVLDWVEPGPPTRQAAELFGCRLAALHHVHGEQFGADRRGFVATVALDNSPNIDWPTFHATQRLAPALATARHRLAIDDADAAVVEQVIDRLPELAGPAEPAARIHGDLWQGNLLWANDGQVWLVDAAAAHDGHRETDLAMLQLFGAPLLAEILGAYTACYPLSAGWRDRVALHQLHPLLVHAALFGAHYGARAGDAARAALA
jgi:fructosamine-3-kinase